MKKQIATACLRMSARLAGHSGSLLPQSEPLRGRGRTALEKFFLIDFVINSSSLLSMPTRLETDGMAIVWTKHKRLEGCTDLFRGTCVSPLPLHSYEDGCVALLFSDNMNAYHDLNYTFF